MLSPLLERMEGNSDDDDDDDKSFDCSKIAYV